MRWNADLLPCAVTELDHVPTPLEFMQRFVHTNTPAVFRGTLSVTTPLPFPSIFLSLPLQLALVYRGILTPWLSQEVPENGSAWVLGLRSFSGLFSVRQKRCLAFGTEPSLMRMLCLQEIGFAK